MRLGKASDAILSENYKSILAAESMIDAIERQDSATLLMIAGYWKDGADQFHENEIRFSEWLGRAKDNITVEGEADVLKAIENDYSAYLSGVVRMERTEKADIGAKKKLYHEEILPSFMGVRNECIRLREINQNYMYKASNRARRISHKAIVSMAATGLAAIATGIFLSFFLTNLLVKPLRELFAATKKVSEGDYNVEVSAGSSDELGAVVDEFNEMVKKLRHFHDLNIKQILEEKRKSEAVIREIDDGIIVVDTELKVTNINPVASRILGVGADKALNRHFLECIKNDDLFHYLKTTAETETAPEFDEGANILTIRRGEHSSHYLFSITTISSNEGVFQGVVLLLRDITKLKELDRLKSDFISTASHELRTPLTTIEMSIGLLMEKTLPKLDERERGLISAAHEELVRLKSLISDLLELSRAESGKIGMQMETFHVGEIIEKAVNVMKRQSDEKGVEMSFSAAAGLPSVKADPNKITWVITNLLSNALRYTGPGGRIRVSAERAGNSVHVSVEDNGSGIPYEYQSRIFDKFVRVESDQQPKGTGLGLAICREVIKAHGGTIWVDSTVGRGSTFTFSLPAGEISDGG